MEGQCFLAQRDNVDYVTHTRDLKNPYEMIVLKTIAVKMKRNVQSILLVN